MLNLTVNDRIILLDILYKQKQLEQKQQDQSQVQ